jgi:hypothetical protein
LDESPDLVLTQQLRLEREISLLGVESAAASVCAVAISLLQLSPHSITLVTLLPSSHKATGKLIKLTE